MTLLLGGRPFINPALRLHIGTRARELSQRTERWCDAFLCPAGRTQHAGRSASSARIPGEPFLAPARTSDARAGRRTSRCPSSSKASGPKGSSAISSSQSSYSKGSTLGCPRGPVEARAISASFTAGSPGVRCALVGPRSIDRRREVEALVGVVDLVDPALRPRLCAPRRAEDPADDRTVRVGVPTAVHDVDERLLRPHLERATERPCGEGEAIKHVTGRLQVVETGERIIRIRVLVRFPSGREGVDHLFGFRAHVVGGSSSKCSARDPVLLAFVAPALRGVVQR